MAHRRMYTEMARPITAISVHSCINPCTRQNPMTRWGLSGVKVCGMGSTTATGRDMYSRDGSLCDQLELIPGLSAYPTLTTRRGLLLSEYIYIYILYVRTAGPFSSFPCPCLWSLLFSGWAGRGSQTTLYSDIHTAITTSTTPTTPTTPATPTASTTPRSLHPTNKSSPQTDRARAP